jgi:GntR family transcriptional repressor for pyruvate dehydrogenase complex
LKIQPLTERRRLADEVAEQLIAMIVDGSLVPNAALPGEAELAERFRVSRTVVREAMRVLASHGMVRIRHGVGSYVNPREDWEVSQPLQLFIQSDTDGLLHWLEVRKILEVGAVRLAATRAEEAEFAELEKHVDLMHQHLRRLSDEFIDVDHVFHLTIARATRNPSLAMVIEPILRPLRGPIRQSLRLPGTAEKAVAEHERIVRALRARDPEQAVQAMEAHLERVNEEVRLLSLVADRSPDAAEATI